MVFKFLVPFGICVINPCCPRNSQICFLSRASLSNTHKNKYGLPWGKQVSPTGKSLRSETLPSRPIYATAAHTLLFQHRSHPPREGNMGDNTWRKNGDTTRLISQAHTGISDAVIWKPAQNQWRYRVRIPVPCRLLELHIIAQGDTM